MAPVHFTISLSGGVVRLQDLSETGGTEVNGQPAATAVLQDGDRIKAGQTVFTVRAPAAFPYPAQLRIGGWGFEVIPEGWKVVGGLGFHFTSPHSFKANITTVEEPLPVGQTLQSYTKTQMELARAKISGITFEGPVATKLPGSDEALTLALSIPQDSGLRVLQRQIYALSSGIVGIFTATILESEPHRDTLDAVIGGLSYFQG